MKILHSTQYQEQSSMFKSEYETNTCINHNRLGPGMNQGIDTGTRCPDQRAIIQKKIHEVLPR
jgi:hypothetical protein